MNIFYQSLPFVSLKDAKSLKRVSIISLKVVKEKSMLYSNRFIRSPEDSYQCIKPFLECRDREYFVVVTPDTKINQHR